MKFELFLVTLLALAGTTLFLQEGVMPEEATQNANLLQLFEQWAKTHNIGILGKEKDYRFAIFQENYEFIQKYNAEHPEITLGLTPFAAMTNEEFKASKTVEIVDAQNFPEFEATPLTGQEPSKFNWVEKGVVNPVQNQGQCGSCWAFSAISSLEGLSAINQGSLQKFSEQQLVSCVPKPFSLGCNGGNPLFAFYYTASAGVQTESSYPYVQLNNGVTAACEFDASQVVFKNKAGAAVKANSPDAMKAQLLKQPLSIAVEASGLVFQLYNGGVIKSNCGTNLDHAIALVGYNTEGDNNYWIVRNSWGTSWGNKGYGNIQISEGDGVCGINMSVSYPTTVSA